MTSLGDQANYRVLYHPEVLTDEARLETSVPPRTPDPHGGGLPHDPGQEFLLRGTPASGPLTSGDCLFEHLVGQSLWEIGKEADADTEPDSLSERYARLAGEGHKLGGYPNFTQQDPRVATDPHVLLFQLDSDDDLDMMWGDVGIANFFIPAEDLARADFSRVAYHWDCC